MDFSKIFIKNASPTKMGGQAVISGIMMKGGNRTAVVLKKKNGQLYIKTKLLKKHGRLFKIPLIRGVFVFIDSLITGTSTLMYSANFLEEDEREFEKELLEKEKPAQEDLGNKDFENLKNDTAANLKTDDSENLQTKYSENQKNKKSKIENWITEKFGEKTLWNIMLFSSVLLSIAFTIGVFIILPTAVVSWCKHFTDSSVALNAIEGVLGLVMFIGYIALISLMKDIREVFEYHGAEHQCIHAYENGLELTPENCRKFETLHPRCGTSFLMFVMIISLVLFSMLGWPNLVWRILSRLLLVPVIAGISYEILRFAGKSDSLPIKILSLPGLLLQKLTTRVPDDKQLEIAIAAINAVDVPYDTPEYEGLVGLDGKPLNVEGKWD